MNYSKTLGDLGDRVDLLISRGDHFGPHSLALANPDGSPVDLTGYTYDIAAEALGISRSAYADLLAGMTRATGKPRDAIDRRTALACAAIAAGLGPWRAA